MVAKICMCVKHLTLLMFVILYSMEFILANKQCKSTVMNVVMKQCSDPGMRSRRDVREIIPDIKPINEKIVNPEDHLVAKRQLTPESIATIENSASPGIAQLIAGRFPRRVHPSTTGARRNRAAQYSMAVAGPSWSYSPYYGSLAVPPTKIYERDDSRFSRGILPEASGGDLGFDLTNDEMVELSNEYFERFARRSQRSPEEAKRLFLETAAKCCQNEEMCLKEKNIISCV